MSLITLNQTATTITKSHAHHKPFLYTLHLPYTLPAPTRLQICSLLLHVGSQAWARFIYDQLCARESANIGLDWPWASSLRGLHASKSQVYTLGSWDFIHTKW